MDSSPREKKSGGWKQRGDSTTWLSLGTRNHEEAERHSVKGARLGWERGGGGGRSTFLGHCLCTSKFVWSGVWTMEKRKGDWFTLWYNPLSRSRSPRSPSASASSASTTYSTDTDVGVVVSLPLSISLSSSSSNSSPSTTPSSSRDGEDSRYFCIPRREPDDEQIYGGGGMETMRARGCGGVHQHRTYPSSSEWMNLFVR